MEGQIFREEALEHHARGSRPGDPLRLDEKAANRWFAATVALVLVAVALSLTLRVPVRESDGVGVTRERVAVALVPGLRHPADGR